jgi:hypothetical protein
MVSSVDPTSIRSIKVGMTDRKVTAIWGQPIEIRPWGSGAEICDSRVRAAQVIAATLGSATEARTKVEIPKARFQQCPVEDS